MPPQPDSSVMSQGSFRKRTACFLLALGIATRVFLALWAHPLYDDAYITFRYSQNFAQGHGLVYVTGEHVLGTSAPLYALLLGILKAALPFASIPGIAVAVGILSYILAFFALSYSLQKLSLRELEADLCLALFSFSPLLLGVSVSGMETPMVIALMLGVLCFGVHRRAVPTGVCGALLLMTRVDGIAWLGMLGLAALIYDRRLLLRASAVLVALTAVGFMGLHH